MAVNLMRIPDRKRFGAGVVSRSNPPFDKGLEEILVSCRTLWCGIRSSAGGLTHERLCDSSASRIASDPAPIRILDFACKDPHNAYGR
jgi:hypothetical protein